MATRSKERPTVVQRLSDPTIEPGYLSLKTPIRQSYTSCGAFFLAIPVLHDQRKNCIVFGYQKCPKSTLLRPK